MDWWKKAGWISERDAEEVEAGPHNGEKRNGNMLRSGKMARGVMVARRGKNERRQKEVQKENNTLNWKT